MAKSTVNAANFIGSVRGYPTAKYHLTLWHGSRYQFTELQAPSVTGNIRPSEEGRTVHLDRVFLTTDVSLAIQHCREHAGDDGYLYEVSVPVSAVTPLLESRRAGGRRKTVRSNPSIVVADPAQCTISAVWRTEALGRHRGYRIYSAD